MRKLIAAGLAVALAACDAEPAADNSATANDAVAVEANAAAPADNAALPAEGANAAAPAAAEVIPAALQGRWGLVPADCTSTLGDAKGLLTISGTELRFYESRGTLRDLIESDANRIVGDFEFMGEGQTWERRMTLTAEDGGTTLVRRESGPDAMGGALRYRKCEA